jgi:hypothetical protein
VINVILTTVILPYVILLSTDWHSSDFNLLRTVHSAYHCAECNFSDCHSTDFHYTDFHSTDCHSTDCHSTDFHSTDCHSTDCHSTESFSGYGKSAEHHFSESHSTDCIFRTVILLPVILPFVRHRQQTSSLISIKSFFLNFSDYQSWLGQC